MLLPFTSWSCFHAETLIERATANLDRHAAAKRKQARILARSAAQPAAALITGVAVVRWPDRRAIGGREHDRSIAAGAAYVRRAQRCSEFEQRPWPARRPRL
jgi:hypothetical protein